MNPNTRSPLTLFLIKKYQASGSYNQGSNSLKLSARFVVNMILREGHRAALVEAENQNFIREAIDEHRPAIVILEALWVTPGKMGELKRAYPQIRFVVRINSEVPFLAGEGIGVEWVAAAMKMGVEIAFNSSQARDDFKIIGESAYLPNYYPLRMIRHQAVMGETIDVGCFGAIRTLKNQLEQAFAAVRYAKELGKPMVFHMNDSADNQEVNAIKKSIRGVVQSTGNSVIFHPWLDHEAFLDLIASMDICLQVSFSESFNITSADAVSMGVPLVGSDAVRWLPKRSKAHTGSSQSIVDAMWRADKTGIAMNHASLEEYLEISVNVWNEFIEGPYVRSR